MGGDLNSGKESGDGLNEAAQRILRRQPPFLTALQLVLPP